MSHQLKVVDLGAVRRLSAVGLTPQVAVQFLTREEALFLHGDGRIDAPIGLVSGSNPNCVILDEHHEGMAEKADAKRSRKAGRPRWRQ